MALSLNNIKQEYNDTISTIKTEDSLIIKQEPDNEFEELFMITEEIKEEAITNFEHEECSSLINDETNEEDCIEFESSKNNRDLFLCVHCNEPFTHKRYLDNHLLYNHSKNVEFNFLNCKYCDSSFCLKRQLREHVLDKHNTELKKYSRIKCEHCNYRTKFINYLKEHILSKHTLPSKSNILAQQCGDSLRQKPGLKRHLPNILKKRK